MRRTRITYTIAAIIAGFRWVKAENRGLHGLDGALTIQPDFQRNYIYGENGRDIALIHSILDDDMIGVVHFYQIEDGKFELIDGQQRITTIGRFITGQFGIEYAGRMQYFSGLGEDLQQRILQYEIDAYIYEGTQDEIKRQFKKINISGIPLTEQEVLNSFYAGAFVSEARTVFSNQSYSELAIWQQYVKGAVNRQGILAVALAWVSDGNAEEYMAKHQHDTNITELQKHFDDVIAWVEAVFTDYHKEMKGIEWGRLYREYGKKHFNSKKIAAKVKELHADPIVSSKRGIFEYVLGGCEDHKLLNVRVFEAPQKMAQYNIQTNLARVNGTSNCPHCAVSGNAKASHIYTLAEMEADHVTAWSKGGATDAANCEMLCKTHNGLKGNR